MSLIFNDDRFRCPNCGNNIFTEEVTFSFIEKKDRYGAKYYYVDDTEYHITCTNCSQIVAVTKKSILNNK